MSSPADKPAATPSQLMGFRGLMRILGVSRTRAYAIYRDRSFPEPWYDGEDEDEDVRLRLWLRDEVEDWIRRNRPDGQ